MPDEPMTRGEINEKIAASEARGETKIARIEGKLDLLLARVETSAEYTRDSIQSLKADNREFLNAAKEDNRATRGNTIAVGIGLAILIVTIVTLFPLFFDIGTHLKEMVDQAVSAKH